MENAISGAVFGKLLLGVVAFSDALGNLTDETASYQAMCTEEDTHRGYFTLNRTTYRVRPAAGEIVYSIENNLGPADRLTNCAIWDSKIGNASNCTPERRHQSAKQKTRNALDVRIPKRDDFVRQRPRLFYSS